MQIPAKEAYRAGRAIISARWKSPVYYANALYAEELYHYIADNEFDTVVMPHLFPAEALIYMLRKHECRPDIHTYFVGTDYTCIPFTEETEASWPANLPVFSLVVRIRPHTCRTQITYVLLGMSSLYMLHAKWIPWQICGGLLMISCVVVHKNSLRQQALEQQEAEGEKKVSAVSA